MPISSLPRRRVRSDELRGRRLPAGLLLGYRIFTVLSLLLHGCTLYPEPDRAMWRMRHGWDAVCSLITCASFAYCLRLLDAARRRGVQLPRHPCASGIYLDVEAADCGFFRDVSVYIFESTDDSNKVLVGGLLCVPLAASPSGTRGARFSFLRYVVCGKRESGESPCAVVCV